MARAGAAVRGARRAGGASRARELGLGIVGLGFMGRTHARSIAALRARGVPCRLAAVCDRDAGLLGGRGAERGNLGARGETIFDPRGVHACGDVDAFLADERVDAVAICTPTDTHVELALRALAAGKHVLLEKPVALDPRAIERLARASAKARRLVMPAMCMRFWPGWTWLKEQVERRTFGAVRSAVFQRLASEPTWSVDFYRDESRSGGALFDLHVHDADAVHWLFGAPTSVRSTGGAAHVTTCYRYARGPRHVVAEGGWDHASGFPFRMRYLVAFERATADFDLARTPPLVLHRDGASEPVDVGGGDGYIGELRHFVEAVRAGAKRISPSLAEAAAVTRTLLAERASCARRP